MKQTSTQQSESIGDELFSVFVAEVNSRGKGYVSKISMLPIVTGGLLPDDTVSLMLMRLAVNPSIFTLILSSEPKKSIEEIIYSDDNDVQRRYLTDMLDDITLNVRLRNPDLFDRNKAILLDQLQLVVKCQTVMSENQSKVFKDALNFFEPLLLTLHYLRKIGYTHELKDIRAEI